MGAHGGFAMNVHTTLRSLLVATALSSACSAPGSSSNTTENPGADDSALDDGQLIAIYNQVNTFDVETGALAVERAHSDEVRALGRMVTTDHTAVKANAEALAATLGVDVVLPPGRDAAEDEHQAALERMQSLSGEAFDRAYLDHEVAFHTAAIAAVKDVLIPAAEHDELVDFMTEVLPGFEHHLAETIRVREALGYAE